MIVVLYTLIQIIIESLPISSSTHARLLCGDNCVSPAYDYFLHGFTVLVIFAYFLNEYFFLLRHMRRVRVLILRLFFTAVVADCMTAIFYFVLPYTSLSQMSPTIGLAITAGALLSTHRVILNPTFATAHLDTSSKNNSWLTRAVIIGIAQGIALLPGISRMGITYATAQWMGLRSYRAMALSLLVQLPLIGAGCLKGLYGLYKTGELVHYMTVSWLLIYTFATISAYVMLCFTMGVAQRQKMWLFGIYIVLLMVMR